MVFSLVYVSSATAQMAPGELDDILEVAVRNNADRGITGALLYKTGNFMQVLEGEELAVRSLYATISLDARHQGELILMQGHQDDREFSRWSMAFRDLTKPGALAAPGFSEFLNAPLTAAEFGPDPRRCHRLLTTFKHNMR